MKVSVSALVGCGRVGCGYGRVCDRHRIKYERRKKKLEAGFNEDKSREGAD